jgi:hypothetical protein
MRTGSRGGFWQQRGWVLLLVVVIATTSMSIDKANYQVSLDGKLAPQDDLIRALVENVVSFSKDENKLDSSTGKSIRIASQWPARTMLACQCDTLPLPPAASDEKTLFAMLRGINFLIFDPRDPVNKSLSKNLALMDEGKVETVVLERGGVIVEIKKSKIAQKK